MPYQRGAQYGYTVGPQIYVRFYLGTDFFLRYFVPFIRNSAFWIRTVLHCTVIAIHGEGIPHIRA